MPILPSETDETFDAPQGGAKRAVIVTARIVTGLVGAGAAAIVVLAATFAPFPVHSVVPRSQVVVPVATTQERVCAGPLLRQGDSEGEQASSVTSFGEPSVRSTSASGRVTTTPLSATDNRAGLAPEVLSVPQSSGQSALIFSGSQSQVASNGDVAGFAAAGCSAGSGDSWLVGGSTATGRSSLVTLSNPSGVDSTVTLTLYGESGLITAAGTDGIVVPARSQKVVPLAGFAPGLASPVVRVQSRGGTIVADLQQTTVRVLDPGGVDIIAPTSVPGTRTVIPGVVLTTSDAVAAAQNRPGYDDLAPIIRALSTGTKDARVSIALIPSGSTSAPIEAGTITIKAGLVTDFALGAYPDGVYTIIVASDQPVVASARTSTMDGAGANDFAWFSGATALDAASALAVAPGPAPRLTLANAGEKAATVKVAPTGGTVTSVVVPAHGSVTVPVDAGGGYVLTPDAPVSIAVSYAGDAALAGFALSPSAPAAQPILIYN